LNEFYHPVKNYDCDLAPQFDITIQEDCRLFHYKNELWISYTELDKGRWDDNRSRDICQCHAKLCFDGSRYYSEQSQRTEYGKNKSGIEKNWTYFDYNGEMWVCYNPAKNEFIRVNPYGNDVLETRVGEKEIFYQYGHLRGGTPPVWIEDKKRYLSFFHGSSANEWLLRRYYMGALLIDPETMKITDISEKPLVFGSAKEEFCGNGNGMCVFPMGKIRKGDNWVVSCGINDTYNALITISNEKVMSSLVPVETFSEKKVFYFKCSGRTAPYDSIIGKTSKWRVVGTSGVRGVTAVLETEDPISIKSLNDNSSVAKITKEEYERLAFQRKITKENAIFAKI
jgi:hypothetical protein